MRFGFLVVLCVFFFYGNAKFHLGKAPLWTTPGLGNGCRKLYQLQTAPTARVFHRHRAAGPASTRPAQPGRYQATTKPASGGFAGTSVSAQQHNEQGQKLTC